MVQKHIGEAINKKIQSFLRRHNVSRSVFLQKLDPDPPDPVVSTAIFGQRLADVTAVSTCWPFLEPLTPKCSFHSLHCSQATKFRVAGFLFGAEARPGLCIRSLGPTSSSSASKCVEWVEGALRSGLQTAQQGRVVVHTDKNHVPAGVTFPKLWLTATKTEEVCWRFFGY